MGGETTTGGYSGNKNLANDGRSRGGQVQRSCEYLRENVDNLNFVLAQLEEKLIPISRMKIPSDTDTDALAKDKEGVGLFLVITEQANRIGIMAKLMEALVGRIEL